MCWQQTALSHSFLNLEPISCSIQGSNCCFLTRIQISQKTGKVVWYFHLFKSFPQLVMIHTQSIRLWCNWWNRDSCFFLEFSNFLFDPTDVGNLISGSFSFSKHSLDIWKFLVCITLKPPMENFKRDLTSMRDVFNCLMVSTSLVLPFLGIGVRIDFF